MPIKKLLEKGKRLAEQAWELWRQRRDREEEIFEVILPGDDDDDGDEWDNDPRYRKHGPKISL